MNFVPLRGETHNEEARDLLEYSSDGGNAMSLPRGRTRAMRHAHCADTESNSAVHRYHSVTSFLKLEQGGRQTIDSIQ